MTHKEHVKKALEEAILFVDSRGYGGVAHIMHDALNMLKEHEPVKPVIDTYFYRCGECGYALCGRTITEPDNHGLRPKYCAECGREVAWE